MGSTWVLPSLALSPVPLIQGSTNLSTKDSLLPVFVDDPLFLGDKHATRVTVGQGLFVPRNLVLPPVSRKPLLWFASLCLHRMLEEPGVRYSLAEDPLLFR